MVDLQANQPTQDRPLRLWPGVVVVGLQWLARFVVPAFWSEATVYGVIGGLVGGLAVVVWWLFCSRAPWGERLGAVGFMALALVATFYLIDESLATGMMGLMFAFYVTPVLSLAFVAWAVVSRRLAEGPRRVGLAVAVLLACGGWTLVRTGGITGDAAADFAWRWSETPEERLLAQAAGEPLAQAVLAAQTGAVWPGFRGPGRDGVIRGLRLETDWSTAPPVELWRQPVGPGWSSFAVSGDLLYTQEQRGEEEVVSCYNATTGMPVWKHRDAARFWESNAGAGPRATPTLRAGRLYTFGATGILNALDAVDGTVLWSRNAATDTGVKIPGWGFASSPLVVDDLVIVAVEGQLVAYDLATGQPHWTGPEGGYGYSSPHLLAIDGVVQVLLARGAEIISLAPADGRLLWRHPLPSGASIVQPALTAGGAILVSDGEKSGMRRLAVTHGAKGWTIKEDWTSHRLKPYFSDFVVHKGHAFGFDGSILACIDVEDGKRRWKGGRYGQGQLVLVADQDLLLVISEHGELALVAASPDGFTELARIPAIDGKTWNHPVLIGDVLLLRNSEEMAALRLALAAG